MSWWVYILQCKDGSLYVGSTTAPARRLKEHAAGKGGAYTRSRLPVALVHQEPHPDRTTAQRREWAIKRLPRATKLDLVHARNAYRHER